jgi:hypothetical protein
MKLEEIERFGLERFSTRQEDALRLYNRREIKWEIVRLARHQRSGCPDSAR